MRPPSFALSPTDRSVCSSALLVLSPSNSCPWIVCRFPWIVCRCSWRRPLPGGLRALVWTARRQCWRRRVRARKTGGAAASQLRPNASGLLRAAVSRREQNSLSLRTATSTPLSHWFPAPAPICFLTWLTHSRVALLTRTLSLLETGALILPVARPLRVTGVALS